MDICRCGREKKETWNICQRCLTNDWRSRNKERVRAYQREWYSKNKERFRDYRLGEGAIRGSACPCGFVIISKQLGSHSSKHKTIKCPNCKTRYRPQELDRITINRR